VAALCLIAYVVGLTEVAKRIGPRAGVVVPLLIAGISLFDAGVVALSGGGIALVALAAAGFPATLMLQRVVPGT
jgi:4-hydroxybenzoate polyprenyltransferase